MTAKIKYIDQVQRNVARILATENIKITQGNYATAAFDLASRTMYMPIFKEGLSKHLTTLFTAHEISHALNTPKEGWHSSIKEMNSRGFSGYLNVIEDARIEKLIKRKYPGLIVSFIEGYKELIADGFFGTDLDFPAMKFIDKLNFATKTNNTYGFDFQGKELGFYKRALETETFEDVRALAQEIYEYEKEKAKNAPKAPEMPTPEQNSKEQSEPEYEDFPGSSSEPSEEETPEEKNEEQSETTEQGESEENSEETEEEETSTGGAQAEETEEESKESVSEDSPEESNGPAEPPKTDEELDEEIASETDENFRDKESEFNQEIGKNDAVEMKDEGITYKNSTINFDDLIQAIKKDYEEVLNVTTDHDAYKQSIKPLVNNLVRQFNLKQNALKMRKNKNVKSGSIDVNKLHSYKTNDDIFLTNTINGKSKNHGMIIMIDWSGSIAGVLRSVIKQAMIQVEFCRKMNIPFEVYTYTRHHSTGNDAKTYLMKRFDSNTKGKKIDEIMKYLYNVPSGRTHCLGFDSMGATPLIEALVGIYKHISDFKSIFNVDRVSLNVICDGDSNGRDVIGYDWGRNESKLESKISGTTKIFEFEGQERRDTWGRSYTVCYSKFTLGQQVLYKELQEIGVDTNLFYISFKDSKQAIGKIASKYAGGKDEDVKKGFYSTNEKFGLNKFFVISAAEAKAEELDHDMKKSEILKTLRKNNKGTAHQKLFVNEFIESIA